MLNYLVRLGWSHGDQEIFTRAELIEKFDFEHVGAGGAKYDLEEAGGGRRASTCACSSRSEIAAPRPAVRARARSRRAGRRPAPRAGLRQRARAREHARRRRRARRLLLPRRPGHRRGQREEVPGASARRRTSPRFAELVRAAEPFSEQELEARINAWMEAQRHHHERRSRRPCASRSRGRSAAPGLFEIMVGARSRRERAPARVRASELAERAEPAVCCELQAIVSARCARAPLRPRARARRARPSASAPSTWASTAARSSPALVCALSLVLMEYVGTPQRHRPARGVRASHPGSLYGPAGLYASRWLPLLEPRLVGRLSPAGLLRAAGAGHPLRAARARARPRPVAQRTCGASCPPTRSCSRWCCPAIVLAALRPSSPPTTRSTSARARAARPRALGAAVRGALRGARVLFPRLLAHGLPAQHGQPRHLRHGRALLHDPLHEAACSRCSAPSSRASCWARSPCAHAPSGAVRSCMWPWPGPWTCSRCFRDRACRARSGLRDAR